MFVKKSNGIWRASVNKYEQYLYRNGVPYSVRRATKNNLLTVGYHIGGDERGITPDMVTANDFFTLMNLTKGSRRNYRYLLYKRLCNFCEWANNYCYTDFEEIHTSPKRVITDFEIKQLFSVANAKEKAIIGLIAYGGLSRYEVINIKNEDVGDKEIKIRGMPPFDDIRRVVNISDELKDSLTDWIKERENIVKRIPESKYISPNFIITRHGGYITNVNSVRNLIYELLKKANLSCGYDELIRCYPTNEWLKGVSLKEIAEKMGLREKEVHLMIGASYGLDGFDIYLKKGL